MVPAAPWELEPRRGLGDGVGSSGSAGAVSGSSLCCLRLGEEPVLGTQNPALSHSLSLRVGPGCAPGSPLRAEHQPPGPNGAQGDFSQLRRWEMKFNFFFF